MKTDEQLHHSFCNVNRTTPNCSCFIGNRRV